nr:glycosyltransferase [Erythrobacter ani]
MSSARSFAALTRREGWRVTVINPISSTPSIEYPSNQFSGLPQISVQEGIEVHSLQLAGETGTGVTPEPAAIARLAVPLARRIDTAHPVDIVDAQSLFPDGPTAAAIAKALGRPLSIKARGQDIYHWGAKDYALEQIQKASDHADSILSVSKALAHEIVGLGLPADKTKVHYTGLDRDRFRPLDHTQLRSQLSQELDFEIPDNAPLLVSVGSLIERKGQHLVIAALPDIPRARLILAGTGEDELDLRRLASETGVAHRIHFAGSLDHDVLPLVLSAADVMVLPAANGGFANAWIESLACGTPVVTSEVGGAREVIANDVAGRLLQERTPQAIAKSVNAVLNSPPKAMDVAALAERFSWDINAAELATHYDRLIANT